MSAHWDRVAELAEAQIIRRLEADPDLERFGGGPSPAGVGCCDYAARTQEHAEAIHARRMAKIIERRRAEASPPPHLDCPYCPACAAPCGTTDRDDVANSREAVACGACGHSWESRADRLQAERSDAAYAAHREVEEQCERDERRLGPKLAARNARMLAELEARASKPPPMVEQLSLIGATR